MKLNRTADLWCKKCYYHTCRCVAISADASVEEALETIWAHQYHRTMTVDDMRRNAVESLIEDLKERDL